MSKGVPGTADRRPLTNPGKQLYRRPCSRVGQPAQVVEGSAGANEEDRLRQKGFVPLKDEKPSVVVEVPKGARRATGRK